MAAGIAMQLAPLVSKIVEKNQADQRSGHEKDRPRARCRLHDPPIDRLKCAFESLNLSILTRACQTKLQANRSER